MLAFTLALQLATATAAPPASDVTVPAADVPDPSEPGFDHGRAALEMAGALAVGTTWYQTQIELNKLDFDFGRTAAEQRRRLLTPAGYRFDDNNRTLNVGHAFMGMYYHQLARANGAGLVGAYLFNLATSSVWELAVEHREVFSLNDTVVTAMGGFSLGEATFQLGELFARSAPTWRNRIAMGLLSPAHLLPGGRDPGSAPWDGRGMAADGAHRVALEVGGALGLGGGAARLSDAGMSARLDAEVIAVRGYGRAGHGTRWLKRGELTRLDLNYVRGEGAAPRMSAVSQTSLVGHYSQAIDDEGAGPRGHALFVGAGSAFEATSEQVAGVRDFVTAVHVLGPMADLSLHHQGLTLRASASLFGDFAMVQPFAPGGIAEAALEGTKSVLRRHQYYYALGATGATRLEARYRGARLGSALELAHFDSIEGLDRRQVDQISPTGVAHPGVKDDFDLVDRRLKCRVFAESPLPLTDVRLGLQLDLQRREGRAQGQTQTGEDARASVVLSYAL
jgi:hypothetical protein